MIVTFLACLVLEKKFLLASLKTLTNSEICSKSRITFLFRLSFALIGKFFLVCIHSRLSESQAGFGTSFKDTSGYQKAGNKLSEEGYWKEFHN
jgi:hypothetical protein